MFYLSALLNINNLSYTDILSIVFPHSTFRSSWAIAGHRKYQTISYASSVTICVDIIKLDQSAQTARFELDDDVTVLQNANTKWMDKIGLFGSSQKFSEKPNRYVQNSQFAEPRTHMQKIKVRQSQRFRDRIMSDVTRCPFLDKQIGRLCSPCW